MTDDSSYYYYSYHNNSYNSTSYDSYSGTDLTTSLMSIAISKLKSSIVLESNTFYSASYTSLATLWECYNPDPISYSYYYDDNIATLSSSSISLSSSSSMSRKLSEYNGTYTFTISCMQQVPIFYVSESNNCSISSYQYSLIPNATCSIPTASPTIAPTSSYPIQLRVTQVISGCSYTNNYLQAPVLYDKTFKLTIVSSLNYTGVSIMKADIINFLVSPIVASTTATRVGSRKLETPSVLISYTLQSTWVIYFNFIIYTYIILFYYTIH